MGHRLILSIIGLYVLSACGGGGHGKRKSSTPNAPTGIAARSDDPGQILIDWIPTPGAADHNIYWSTTPGVTKTTGTSIAAVTAPYLHTGLTGGTTYYYVVTASNGSAESTESVEASAMPLDAPTGVTATGDTGEITVGWSPATGASSYNLYWSTNPGVTKATGNLLAGVTAPYLHGALPNGTTNYYVVTATNTVGGGAESAESAEVSATPLAAPTGVVAAGGMTDVTLSWSIVTAAGSYNVYWSTTPGVSRTTGTLMADVTSPHLHSGLTSGTAYYYVVTALDSVGGGSESAESTEVSSTPLASPTGLLATGGTAQAMIAWNLVVGATGYNLYWSVTPGVTTITGTPLSGVSSPYLLTGLVDGTTYYFIVTATIPGSESAPSLEVFAMPVAVPGGVTGSAGTGQVTIDWSPAAGATSYNIYWSVTPGVTKLTGTLIAAVTAPYLHTGLSDGAAHYHVVTAVNAVGGGAESIESVEVVTMPIAAPVGVSAMATSTDITVDWSPVAGATSYNLYWSITPGVTKATGTLIGSATAPYLHTGLTAGTPYFYVVTALSTVGAGSESIESVEVSVVPLAAPGGLAASAGSADVNLSWSPVAGATSYNLYWGTTPSVTVATGTIIPGVSSPYLHSGLTNATTYYYISTAAAASSESAGSAEVFAMPIAAPAGVFATSTSTDITVDWSPVAGATSFNLYWSNTPGVTKSTGTLIAAATAPYLHTGLAGGTTYYYVVTALNAVGGGAESAESAEVLGALGAVGSLDITFNGQGWISNDGAAGGNGDDEGRGVDLDASGRILVAGASISAAGSNDMAIWRVNDDGSLDLTFNGQGSVVHNDAAGGSGADLGYGLVIDASGRLVVAGTSWAPGGTLADLAVWRFNPDASLDLAFGGLGFVSHNNAGGGNKEDVGLGTILDASGRIFVAGFSRRSGGNDDMVIWRYDPDGSLDLTFNGQGWVTHNTAAGGDKRDRGNAIALDSAGRMVVAGRSRSLAGNEDLAVWRFNGDGSLDLSFNGQGWAVHDGAAGGGANDEGHGVAVDATDRIVVTGSSANGLGDIDMVTWRFNVDGTLDVTFGGQGWVSYDNAAGGLGADEGNALTLEASGRILVAGSSVNAAANEDMTLWRLNADGTLDASFNGQGWIVHDNAAGGSGKDLGRAIILDPSSRILVAGSSENAVGNMDMVVWRIN